MNLLFSLLSIAPLLAFMSDPVGYTWTPWLSLAVVFFGCFILIPRRRFFFTIPLVTTLITLFAMLTLLEAQWLQTTVIVLMGLGAWHWWSLTQRGEDKEKDFQYTLLLYTLVFLFSASYAGNAYAIYIDEPLWKITTVFFLLSVSQYLSIFLILRQPRVFLSAFLTSLLTIELFLATFYLPVSFYIKSLVLAFFSSSVIDLSLRHYAQTLTLRRVRLTLLAFILITAALLATAEWI